MVRLDIPADLRFLRLARTFVATRLQLEPALEPADIEAIVLAVNEICANIVTHAYDADTARRYDITVTVSGDQVEVLTQDTGRALDPARLAWPPPDCWAVRPTATGHELVLRGVPEPEISDQGGYGLYLSATILDEIIYDSSANGNRWRLVRRLPDRQA